MKCLQKVCAAVSLLNPLLLPRVDMGKSHSLFSKTQWPQMAAKPLLFKHRTFNSRVSSCWFLSTLSELIYFVCLVCKIWCENLALRQKEKSNKILLHVIFRHAIHNRHNVYNNKKVGSVSECIIDQNCSSGLFFARLCIPNQPPKPLCKQKQKKSERSRNQKDVKVIAVRFYSQHFQNIYTIKGNDDRAFSYAYYWLRQKVIMIIM